MKDWKNIKKSRTGQEYVEEKILSQHKNSDARALFFRNTHESTGEKIVSLKIARRKYNSKTESWRTNPDKSITLNSQELDSLIEYIQEYYQPLSFGLTSFIEADQNSAAVFEQIRKMNIPDDEIASDMLNSGFLSDNLSVAIRAVERSKSADEFKRELFCDHDEHFWQKWFSKNKWVLGSDYIQILKERDIDVNHIADYLIKSADGFLDVVEIKRPDLPFWSNKRDHNNLCPSTALTSAITQCLNYLYHIELQSNSVEFIERTNGTKTIKPQCLLVFGRSHEWGEQENKAYRILNTAYHQLHIMTYDQLLSRAQYLSGQNCTDE